MLEMRRLLLRVLELDSHAERHARLDRYRDRQCGLRVELRQLQRLGQRSVELGCLPWNDEDRGVVDPTGGVVSDRLIRAL